MVGARQRQDSPLPREPADGSPGNEIRARRLAQDRFDRGAQGRIHLEAFVEALSPLPPGSPRNASRFFLRDPRPQRLESPCGCREGRSHSCQAFFRMPGDQLAIDDGAGRLFTSRQRFPFRRASVGETGIGRCQGGGPLVRQGARRLGGGTLFGCAALRFRDAAADRLDLRRAFCPDARQRRSGKGKGRASAGRGAVA